MKLLNEVIENLSSESYNLSDALLKTKVLLHQLGRKELAEWVSQELAGYSRGDNSVPDYRRIHALVRGTVTNGAYIYKNHQLPTLHLKEEHRKRWEDLAICESVSSIEQLTQGGKADGHLSVSIPVEAYQFFDKALDGGYRVQSAWSEIGRTQLNQILIQIRSRLLDFLLELRDKVGDDATDEDVKKIGRSAEMTSMFNHAIFGDNVTIVVGNSNTQNVQNKITKGDFKALAEVLKANNVAVADVDALEVAIKEDSRAPEIAQKKFGPSVRGWMTSMIGKAIDTSWAVEVSIGANLLTDALKHYYGWFGG